MKWLAIGLILAVIASGILPWQMHKRTAPSISVWIQDDTGGGGGPDLPAVDNYVNGDAGMDGQYTHVGKYRIVADSAGKFFVLAHYQVQHNGAVAEFDRCLPVYDIKPERTDWTRLDSHLAAVAFYDGGTIRY
jgi:hypothetical protein